MKGIHQSVQSYFYDNHQECGHMWGGHQEVKALPVSYRDCDIKKEEKTDTFSSIHKHLELEGNADKNSKLVTDRKVKSRQ